jgi:hypothetical protein
MAPTVRLFGRDREEIHDLDSWFAHAPPEKGMAQWRDGYSAKEQAKAWLRSGSPAVPEELWSTLEPLVAGEVDEVYARPEHTTRLDRFRRSRQHDLFACARRAGQTELVVGVEAKACESFDGVVADRASAAPPSNKRARCNLLSRALFERDVIDERTGAILDERLGRHGYQLWTAAVGTIIEAQRRGQGRALLVVHQFVPRDLTLAARADDARDWPSALTANAQALDAFVADLQAAGATSHQTEFVQRGTTLDVVKVQSIFED